MSRHLDKRAEASPSGRPVDRSATAPLYYQLKQWLSNRILSGELGPGAQLPGELELCERFGVSRASFGRRSPSSATRG